MENNEKSKEHLNIIASIILFLILLALFFNLKRPDIEKAKSQLNLLKSKLAKHEALKNQIEVRVKTTKRNLRIIVATLFFVFEMGIFLILFFFNRDVLNCLGNLLIIDTIVGAILTVISWAVFGIKDLFKKMGDYFDLKIEQYVFKNSRELKVEIERLKVEAKNKEEEIKELEEIELILKEDNLTNFFKGNYKNEG